MVYRNPSERTAGATRVLPASTLIGDDVWNPEGEKLGVIEDLVIDLSHGCVSYAVLSFGGFLGIGDKLFAIPWNLLSVDTQRKGFILDVDKEVLEKAPGFDKDNWPDMADSKWSSDIHSYYGTQRPDW